MNSTKEFLYHLADPNLSSSERAQLRCKLAAQLEEAGDYEAAREALADLWSGVAGRPNLEGLDERSKAEVLLRVGALTGWIGSTRQIEGSQEAAKNLLTESILLFQALGEAEGMSAAQTDLAYCYWREGGFSEARVMLEEALNRLTDINIETKAVALLRSVIVEMSDRRFHEALRIHAQAASIFERISNHLLRGKFHNTRANVLNYLSTTEDRGNYVDDALIEYAAASFHFEQAGHIRYEACVENNLGFLFSTIGKFRDAHEHLDRAQVLFTRLQDDLHLAQVDQTRARVMLAEGRAFDAEKTVRKAVRILEQGDELSLLAEAITTHGIALARLNHTEKARATFSRAADVAERAGDSQSAGLAALALMEELGEGFSSDDSLRTLDRAGTLVNKTQDLATARRLANAGLGVLRTLIGPPDWSSFQLKLVVDRYEGHWIRLALRETGGLVTRAARLLGFRHHQSLLSLINSRHQDLVGARSAVRKRRHHLIEHPKRGGKKLDDETAKAASKISILHVEDNKEVASIIKETLELEGWRIESCVDGAIALEMIASDASFDLLILDNDLPGVNGLEIVQRTRSMPHRRAIPIIILSATLGESAAHEAGADRCLRKPEDVAAIVETVAHLLHRRDAKAQPGT